MGPKWWSKLLFSGILAFAMLSCGRAPTRNFSGPTVPYRLTGNEKVILALFGAPWCSECKHAFPAIQKLLNGLSQAQRDAIGVVLYSTSNANSSEPPTQAVADTYRDVLKMRAIALPDLPFPGKIFRSYVGGKVLIPAGAVLGPDRKVMKSFRAGATSFVPSDIVRFAVESLP